METNKLLDECKAKLHVETDYALAKKFDLHNGLISDYRSGKRIPDALACFKIAEVLGLDEKKLIAQFEAMSAKNEKVREYWEKKLAELGGIAASIIFAVVTLIVTPTPSQAAPVANSGVYSVYYVK